MSSLLSWFKAKEKPLETKPAEESAALRLERCPKCQGERVFAVYWGGYEMDRWLVHYCTHCMTKFRRVCTEKLEEIPYNC